MPKIEMGADFNTVKEDTAFKPLPVGEYTLQVNECILAVSDKKQKPMLKFTLLVTSNPNPELNGKQLFYYGPLPCTQPVKDSFISAGINGSQAIQPDGSNSGVGLLISILEALGKPWDGAITTEDYVGATCTAQVDQRTYEDRLQNSVKFK